MISTTKPRSPKNALLDITHHTANPMYQCISHSFFQSRFSDPAAGCRTSTCPPCIVYYGTPPFQPVNRCATPQLPRPTATKPPLYGGTELQ